MSDCESELHLPGLETLKCHGCIIVSGELYHKYEETLWDEKGYFYYLDENGCVEPDCLGE